MRLRIFTRAAREEQRRKWNMCSVYASALLRNEKKVFRYSGMMLWLRKMFERGSVRRVLSCCEPSEFVFSFSHMFKLI